MLGNHGTMYHPQYPNHFKNKIKIMNQNKNNVEITLFVHD